MSCFTCKCSVSYFLTLLRIRSLEGILLLCKMSFGQIGSWALTAGKIAVATRLIHCVSPCVPGYVVAAGHIVVPACIDAVRNAIAGSDAVDDGPDNSSWESPTNDTTDISENSAIYEAPSGSSETGTEGTCSNCLCTTEDDQEIYYDAEDGSTGCSKPIPTMLTNVGPFSEIVIGNFKWTFEFGEPSPRAKQMALNQLRETPENMINGLAELNRLLNTEQNLKCPRDDLYLLRYLRTCKFYPKSAFDLIKRHYTFRAKHSDIFDDLKPSNMKRVFDENLVVALPNRDQFGRRVSIFELGRWNPSRLNLIDIFKISVIFLESALWEPETQINGVVIIFDMRGLSVPTALQLKPDFGKLTVDWLQDCVPLRIKGIHFVNEPFYVNSTTNPMPRFMRPKHKARYHCHGNNRSSLHRHISAECLPVAYGGKCTKPRVNGDHWYRFFVQAEREFETINSYGYNK